MSIAVGVILALAIGAMTTLVGLDRDRALYPVVMMVIAAYYVLFALISGSTHLLVVELLIAAVFVGLAIAGFLSSLWLVAIALAAHGIFDLAHPHIYSNPGVPSFWPPFCVAYDVVAAVYLGWLLARNRVRARPA